MTTWRYQAIPSQGGAIVGGQMAAESAADVRASLRRAGLRTLRIAAVRTFRFPNSMPLAHSLRRWARSRRRHAKADVYESLATMLDAGVSMSEALETLGASRAGAGTREAAQAAHRESAPARKATAGPGKRSAQNEMCGRLKEAIRSGRSLADAMESEPFWFDGAEVAMGRAGEHRGDIAGVLRALAERHHRAGEILAKITAALAYPTIVSLVGVGVVVFLSTNTLPQLVGVLREARVGVPPLTLGVMSVGRTIAHGWTWMVPGLLAAALLTIFGTRLAHQWGYRVPAALGRIVPRALREATIATACLDLSDLVRVGVPLTEALRVLAPSLSGPIARGLGRRLEASATGVERGAGFVDTLDDSRWFDAEFVRLMGVGESAGELHAVLRQIGDARRRRAHRNADRLAGLLEPAVIVVLAVLVGVVVMAAVLPMLRLQEVI